MALDPISAIGDLLTTGINKIFPDANVKIEQVQQLAAQVHQQYMGQLAINQEEAKSESLFVAGWRPYIGWICGIGLSYNWFLQDILAWISLNLHLLAPPGIDPENMVAMNTILGTLLGVNIAARTVDKVASAVWGGKASNGH